MGVVDNLLVVDSLDLDDDFLVLLVNGRGMF